jgi:hypothetical protein
MNQILLSAAFLFACSTQEIARPNPPPTPPTADLWPLGGYIYHGTPLPEDHHAVQSGVVPTSATSSGTPTIEGLPSSSEILTPTEEAPSTTEAEDAEAEVDGAMGDDEVEVEVEDENE